MEPYNEDNRDNHYSENVAEYYYGGEEMNQNDDHGYYSQPVDDHYHHVSIKFIYLVIKWQIVCCLIIFMNQ